MNNISRMVMRMVAIALLIVSPAQARSNKEAPANAQEYNLEISEDYLDQLSRLENDSDKQAYAQHILKAQNADLLKRAQEGDPKAQEDLASAYEYGRDGFEQNDLLALEWYKKAAAQGNSWAIASVALLLLKGDLNTSAADAKAATLEWMESHAEQKILWRLSVNIQDLTNEDIESLRLYTRLERAGSAAGCDIYREVTCTPEIKKSGILMIKSIAEADMAEAQTMWGKLLFRKDFMSAIDLEPDPQTGLAYLQKGAAGGDLMAFVEIGRVYEHGRGVESDKSKALEWYDRYIQRVETLRKEAEAENRVETFESESLVRCKLHLLRGDELMPVAKYECESNRWLVLSN